MLPREPVAPITGAWIETGVGGATQEEIDVAPITVGAHCQFGPNVQLLTPSHELDAERRREGWEKGDPITIGDNVWLGGGVIVCPGVTIGDDTVVGAGAVVTRDLPRGVLAVGNPARVVRALT